MSEAELFVMRARLQGSILNKARRGALKLTLPIGLCYTEADAIVLDPERPRTICHPRGLSQLPTHRVRLCDRAPLSSTSSALPTENPSRTSSGRSRLGSDSAPWCASIEGVRSGAR
ncbi:hypothetical protein [Ktedonobacter sp. SOSP1-85]|uniref:hypothetical protein n=1 Tax=Ktedonobacter sp. SOSP1-85 TaxID=2778367 RepID=UPI0019150096|nr:hypothetical protein [Ktedonobacter sp. SOSP1-85]